DTVRLVSVGAVLAGLLTIWLGWREVLAAGKLSFFLLRRERAASGWRLVLGGIGAAVLGAAGGIFGRPVAYVVFQATPSPSPTATVTPRPSTTFTPTITLTPTISATPTITATATITPTPMLPDAVAVLLIHETVTPDPAAAFSPLRIARRLDSSLLPVDPALEFENPIDTLYAAFTYNRLQDGVRWTAVWYRLGEVVCLETTAWQSGTGGYGYAECAPGRGWLAGEYEVQIFYGERWMVSERFRVTGTPPTRTPSASPSATGTP
ncbi:MAG: hypothetical protein ACRDHY_07660, partial [Anaerolineales bacterium]